MNGFLSLSFAIILSSTLVKLSCVTAREVAYVDVHNSFSDGREMAVLCYSKPRPRPHETLVSKTITRGESASWGMFHFTAETLHICRVAWQTRFINQVRYKFKAFKGSWPHYNYLRNPLTGIVQYNWVFNATGFGFFDYTWGISRQVVTLQELMSSARFHQPVQIKVTNGFTHGRIVHMVSYSNQGANDQPIAAKLTPPGDFNSWTIDEFKTRTINTCIVNWWYSDNQAIYSFPFEAFIGGWRIDASRINPWTGETQYAWFVNETGAYLLNFVNRCYELKWPAVHVHVTH